MSVDFAGLGQLLGGFAACGAFVLSWSNRRQLRMTNGLKVGEAVEQTHTMTLLAEPHHRDIMTEVTAAQTAELEQHAEEIAGELAEKTERVAATLAEKTARKPKA